MTTPRIAWLPPGSPGEVLQINAAGGLDWGPGPEILNIKDYGAACDDTTDDTAAIQAAIDMAGDTSVITRTGVEVLISGPCRITSTLLIHRKSITLRGLGFGSRGAAPPNCYLRWDGVAGVPMVRIQDTRGGARVAQLRFIGASAAKPDSAISFYETNDGVPNIGNVVENVSIGYRVGEPDAVEQFTHGIRLEGDLNINNDELIFRNVHIQGCTGAGIRIGGTQNVALRLERVSIANAQYGIQCAGNFVATSLVFASITAADLYAPVQDDYGTPVYSAQFHIRDYISEHMSRLALLDGGAILTIEGGYFQIGSALHADGKVIKSETSTYVNLVLRHIQISQGDGSPATPAFMSLKAPPSSTAAKHIVLDGVDGWASHMTGGPNSNGLDVALASTTDIRTVYFRDVPQIATALPSRLAQNILAGTTGLQWDPTRWDIPYSVALLAASPTILTADQHNYDPSRASFWRLASDASRTITGLAGWANGRWLILANVGAQNIVLANQSASSTAENRIITGTGADLTIAADTSARLIYDATTSRWRVA